MLEWYDLNARHEATLFWVAAVFVLASVRSTEFRTSLLSLLKTLFEPQISLLIFGLFANAAIVTLLAVIVGRAFGLWETLPVVTATIWSLTSGLSLLLNLETFLESGHEFRKRVITVLGPATVLTEVVAVAILPIWWELLFVPGVTLLALAVATRTTRLTMVSTGLLLVIVVGLISSVAVDLADAPETWRSLAQALIFPIVLTIGTLPYIQLVIVLERLSFKRGVKHKTVRSSEYGLDWPLTVDSAELCYKLGAVWLESNGKRYGMNGSALPMLRKQGHACLDLSEILRDHPDKGKWTEDSGNCGDEIDWKVSDYSLLREGLAMEHRP